MIFTTTLQPLGLAFFNSINKLLTILYFESFPTFFYLLFFSYMLYNSKQSKFFKACSQLALKNSYNHFGNFFIMIWSCVCQESFEPDLILWSAVAQIFARAKKGILSLQTLISCNLHRGNFWIFFKSSQTSALQHHTVTCIKKMQKFGTCTRNGSFLSVFGDNMVKKL